MVDPAESLRATFIEMLGYQIFVSNCIGSEAVVINHDKQQIYVGSQEAAERTWWLLATAMDKEFLEEACITWP